MSVSIGIVQNGAAGPRPVAGTPRLLFEGRYERSDIRRNYDLAPDGRRFVMVVGSERDEGLHASKREHRYRALRLQKTWLNANPVTWFAG